MVDLNYDSMKLRTSDMLRVRILSSMLSIIKEMHIGRTYVPRRVEIPTRYCMRLNAKSLVGSMPYGPSACFKPCGGPLESVNNDALHGLETIRLPLGE